MSILKFKYIKIIIDNIETSIDNSPTLNPKTDTPTNDLENKNTNEKNENTKIDSILKILGFNNLFIIFQLVHIIQIIFIAHKHKSVPCISGVFNEFVIFIP